MVWKLLQSFQDREDERSDEDILKAGLTEFATGLHVRYDRQGLSRWLSGKESACQCRCGFNSWVRKIPKWQPTSVFLPGKSHEQSSLAGYSPWSRKRVRQHWAAKQQDKKRSQV